MTAHQLERHQAFGHVIEDLSKRSAKFVKEGALKSVYLIAGAARRPPLVHKADSSILCLGDVDLLIICKDGSRRGARAQDSLMAQSNRNHWGIYRSIHVGARLRPQRDILRTALEYASWGERVAFDSKLLAGQPAFSPFSPFLYSQELRVSADRLYRNVLATVWLYTKNLRMWLLGERSAEHRVRYLYHQTKCIVRLATLVTFAKTREGFDALSLPEQRIASAIGWIESHLLKSFLLQARDFLKGLDEWSVGTDMSIRPNLILEMAERAGAVLSGSTTRMTLEHPAQILAGSISSVAQIARYLSLEFSSLVRYWAEISKSQDLNGLSSIEMCRVLDRERMADCLILSSERGREHEAVVDGLCRVHLASNLDSYV